jgi:hypothetical protein
MADDNAELGQKVLGLRRAGAQFDVIAERLNLTPTAAKALFDKAIAAYDPELSSALEADRLKISERREQVLVEPTPNDHALRKAYDASIASSAQVQPVDQSLIEFGRTIADRVDEAVATGKGQEVTKALYLVPHAVNILREALATPASRHAAGLAVNEHKDGRLATLRAVQGKGKGAKGNAG